jgi:lysophospholipase L1-like esterase
MKIYVIGDSISIQYGPYLRQYIAGIIDYARKEGEHEALLNLDNPQGANGGDSSMVLSFLQGVARNGGIDADLLLVNCGLHDIKTNPQTGKIQIPIADYGNNLKAIVAVARKMKIDLVWIRTTPCDEKIHNRTNIGFHRFSADCNAYNAAADLIMNEAKVPIIVLYSFTRNLGQDLYCDHVHFHESVREKQAAFIAGWLSCCRVKEKLI